VSCAPAFLSPLGGSSSLVGGICERRLDTQIVLAVRLRTDQAVAKCFGFLARPELGDDLPCQTVDDDEILQDADSSTRDRDTGFAEGSEARLCSEPSQISAFKLSGRSTSEFFGVIRVRRQHSVAPANRDDHAL
jgi:hypothetical protein